jgi:hypothetical protein
MTPDLRKYERCQNCGRKIRRRNNWTRFCCLGCLNGWEKRVMHRRRFYWFDWQPLARPSRTAFTITRLWDMGWRRRVQRPDWNEHRNGNLNYERES